MPHPEVNNIFEHLSQTQLIQIGCIVLSAWLLIALTQRALSWLADRFTGRKRHFLLATVSLLRLSIIMTVAIMVIYRVIEPTFENVVALLGVLGLTLGFAFKDYISSLIAGIVVLFEMPYRPGDWIEVNGVYGEVRSIEMRAVEIVTPDDTVVVIPHVKIWNEPIMNSNDGGTDLMCVADFYLHPDHDPRTVKRLLHDVALTSPYLQLEREILIVAMEKPWGTHYRLKAYPADARRQFAFITDLIVRAKDVLADCNIAYAIVPVAEVGSY